MRISLTVSLAVLAVGCAHAPEEAREPAPQKAADPKELSAQAYKSYDARNFSACAEQFRQAAEAQTDEASRADSFYSAADCAALAGDTSKALEMMKRSVQSGYFNADYAQADPELLPLHVLPDWQEVIAGATANLAKSSYRPQPVPVLAAVDVYGSRRADVESVRRKLGLELGKPFVGSTALFHQKEEALKKQYNLAFAKLSVITYFRGPEANKAYVTADLVDAEDAQRLKFLPAPSGHPADPEGLVAQWQEYESKGWMLMKRGQLDLSKPGTCRVAHCIMGFSHPELAPYEPIFLEKVPQAQDAVAQVLREDADEHNRAAAAFLLAYAATPEQAIERLAPSIRDPSALVRNNVLRVMMALQQAADRPLVDVAVVVDALSMPETTDRNKAGHLLKALLEHMKPEEVQAQKASLLRQLGPQLVAMAGMQQPINREPAVGILQLLSGEKYDSPEQWKAWLARQPQ